MKLFRLTTFPWLGLIIVIFNSYAYDITVPGVDDLEGVIGGIRLTTEF
jgi:hypothetical protein